MRKFAILGASAFVLALSIVGSSAEPFNPVSGYSSGSNAASGSAILQQYHEGK